MSIDQNEVEARYERGFTARSTPCRRAGTLVVGAGYVARALLQGTGATAAADVAGGVVERTL